MIRVRRLGLLVLAVAVLAGACRNQAESADPASPSHSEEGLLGIHAGRLSADQCLDFAGSFAPASTATDRDVERDGLFSALPGFPDDVPGLQMLRSQVDAFNGVLEERGLADLPPRALQDLIDSDDELGRAAVMVGISSIPVLAWAVVDCGYMPEPVGAECLGFLGVEPTGPRIPHVSDRISGGQDRYWELTYIVDGDLDDVRDRVAQAVGDLDEPCAGQSPVDADWIGFRFYDETAPYVDLELLPSDAETIVVADVWV